jgi:hypothetical protein
MIFYLILFKPKMCKIVLIGHTSYYYSWDFFLAFLGIEAGSVV